MTRHRSYKRVPNSIKSALAGDLRQPDLAELVAWFFKAAGGPKKVGELLFREFEKAKEGSMIRQRILDMILRNARHVSDKSAPEDLGLLSDDDLEREILSFLPETPETDEQPPAAPEPDRGA